MTLVPLLITLVRHHCYGALMLEVLVLYFCNAFSTLGVFQIRIFVDGMRSLPLIIQLIEGLLLLINRSNRLLVFERALRVTVLSPMLFLLRFHPVVRRRFEWITAVIRWLHGLFKFAVLYVSLPEILERRTGFVVGWQFDWHLIVVYLSLAKLLHHELTISLINRGLYTHLRRTLPR